MIERIGDKGRYFVFPVGTDAVWFHFEGFIGGDCWPPTETFLDSVIAERGSVLMLGNGENWKNYEPVYRQGCTAWFVRRRLQIRGVHLLIGSKILKMGVQVVNLVVPIITAYDTAAAFNARANELVPFLETRVRRAGLELPGAKSR